MAAGARAGAWSKIRCSGANIDIDVRGKSDRIYRFWGTLGWSNNPWIQDGNGLSLKSATYDRIAICPISDLHIRRTGPTEFIFRIKPVGPRSFHHSQPKLRRWATAILLASPTFPIGGELALEPELVLRHAPPFDMNGPGPRSNKVEWSGGERGTWKSLTSLLNCSRVRMEFAGFSPLTYQSYLLIRTRTDPFGPYACVVTASCFTPIPGIMAFLGPSPSRSRT
uniref:Uncharacterized protein n=1 Tax=Peronospora matthiolae TaxID=2874970 RepID=A0AAV1T259_9STRA